MADWLLGKLTRGEAKCHSKHALLCNFGRVLRQDYRPAEAEASSLASNSRRFENSVDALACPSRMRLRPGIPIDNVPATPHRPKREQ